MADQYMSLPNISREWVGCAKAPPCNYAIDTRSTNPRSAPLEGILRARWVRRKGIDERALLIFSFHFIKNPKARDTVHGSRQDGLGQLESPAGWLHPHTGTHLIRRYFRTVSQRGRIPPFPLSCSSSTMSMTSSEYFSFSYPCLSIWGWAQIFLC